MRNRGNCHGSQMVAVAAHDVGEYIRIYPRGKKAIDSLGAKTAIMRHMVESDDASVRYEALVAIQKIMTHNWFAQPAQMHAF